MTRFLAFRLALIALAWSAFGAAAQAQTVEIRGVVRDSATGNPVSGAVVLALDAVGTTMGRTITSARGQYRLTKPAGALLIRTIHIGYRATTERLPTFATDAITIDLVMATLPRELQTMQVSAARGCPSRADEAQAFALLDQARAGLLATVVARERLPAQLLVLRYERFLDVDGVEAVRQIVHIDSSQSATTSFNAVRNAVDFVAAGFRAGAAGQYTYYGPDAEVLLDERFQRGYCFSLAAADTARRSQVGLRFTAAGKRDGRVDIDGTLWIDTVARSLHDIAFRFVGVEPLAESFNAGGSVSFVTLPNGIPFIDKWSLRLVGGSEDADTRATSQVYEIREVGGELARAKWPDGETWLGAQSSVHLTATTRDGVPARTAVLNLVDTDYRATTDSAGRATIQYVLPGPYTVAQDDATLKPIGLQIPAGRSLVVTRGSSPITRVTLATPVQHVGAMCGGTTPSKSESWVVARVVGSDGKPVGGVHWRASRDDNGRWRVFSENGITASDGLILLCRGVVRESRIEVAAWRDPKDAVRVQRTVNEPLSVMRVPLPTTTIVAAAKPKGNSDNAPLVVSGSVRDSTTGALVADARVTFVGTPFEGSTDVSGMFVVGGLAAGDYTVEVSTPSLDSIGVVSRTAVTLASTTSALSLFAPSLSAILTSACGGADATGFVVGSVGRRGGAAMPDGVRVVAEWEEMLPDSVKVRMNIKSGMRTAWRSAEIGSTGTYRLCGVPAATRVIVRTESDSATPWSASPRTVSLVADRRFARVDLQLDSTVTTLATLSGIVVADSAGTPLENIEVRLTDIDRSVLTDRRGAFRFSDLPEGAHLMSIRRVGYAPVVTPINLVANSANQERVQLDRTTALATVAVEGVFGMKEFEDRRKSGIGYFLTREQLDKQKGRRLGDVASQINGFGSMMGGSGRAFPVGRRATPPSLREGLRPGMIAGSVPLGMNKDSLPPSLYERAGGGYQTFTKEGLADAGYYCPTTGEEASTGIKECSCFAQVYVNGRLMNSGKPTEPFDVNSLVVDEVEGVEFYPTPASTPGRYSNLNARCGVMLVWTRR